MQTVTTHDRGDRACVTPCHPTVCKLGIADMGKRGKPQRREADEIKGGSMAEDSREKHKWDLLIGFLLTGLPTLVLYSAYFAGWRIQDNKVVIYLFFWAG